MVNHYSLVYDPNCDARIRAGKIFHLCLILVTFMPPTFGGHARNFFGRGPAFPLKRQSLPIGGRPRS